MTKNGIVMTILQEKGGCGKSSAIFNISYYLSRKYKTLIIDLDGQAADITYYLFGNKVGNSKDSMRTDILTIMDVFRGTSDITDVILPVQENLDVIPANIHVANISQNDKITIFKKNIRRLQEIYDYILIDVPPSPNWSHILCLSVCQYVIPIVNPDSASPKALISLNESIEEVQETTNPNAKYLGIIVNKYDGRTNLAKKIVEQVEKIAAALYTSLFETKIHQSVVLSEQMLFHQSIFDYSSGSKASKEYAQLAREILERIDSEKGGL